MLLWIDLTHDCSAEALIDQFRSTCECRPARVANLAEQVLEQRPDMICIHFDHPDAAGLRLLQEVKRDVPSTPITMFTVQHSEELAVWAMRAGVWEYMPLPVSAAEKKRYLDCLTQLQGLRQEAPLDQRKPHLQRGCDLPDSIRLTRSHQKQRAIQKALLHIDQHFRKGVDQKELAQHCGMTPFRFCRLFKEQLGVGFMEYILRKRMDYAKELLDNSQMPITSIGYEAGFKDPSYFARTFKQNMGCTPSEYRSASRPEARKEADGSPVDLLARALQPVFGEASLEP